GRGPRTRCASDLCRSRGGAVREVGGGVGAVPVGVGEPWRHRCGDRGRGRRRSWFRCRTGRWLVKATSVVLFGALVLVLGSCWESSGSTTQLVELGPLSFEVPVDWQRKDEARARALTS